MLFSQAASAIKSLTDLVDDLKACDPDAFDHDINNHVNSIIASHFNIIKRSIDQCKYSELSGLYLKSIKIRRKLLSRNDQYNDNNKVIQYLSIIIKMTNRMMELKVKRSKGFIFNLKRIFRKAIF